MAKSSGLEFSGSVIWYFVVAIWIPIYIVIYWGPHMVGSSAMKRDLALWIRHVGGPIAWLTSFEANMRWRRGLAFFMQGKLALYVVSLVALAVAAAAGWWHGGSGPWTRQGMAGQGGGVLPRSRIMAIGGVLLSAMFFMVILAQAIPAVILDAMRMGARGRSATLASSYPRMAFGAFRRECFSRTIFGLPGSLIRALSFR